MAIQYGEEPENAVKFEFDEGKTGPVQRLMVKFFTSQFWSHMDILCVRHFGGSVTTRLTSIAKDMPYQPTIVLRTIGARTGQIRTCTLPYVMDEGCYCVVGTRAGGPIHPAWVLNLRRARPSAKPGPIYSERAPSVEGIHTRVLATSG